MALIISNYNQLCKTVQCVWRAVTAALVHLRLRSSIGMQDENRLPTRPLGRTGDDVTLFALGGEGVLRTHGRLPEAAQVIHRALDQGVNYCDTAPAYDRSMDYYGAALGERRAEIFLASKTQDRTRDGSLRLLDDSLRRLQTDHLDLWQLHDLRRIEDLDAIFSKGGAIEALTQAREQGLVRFLGITGHHAPDILMEAMRRFDFDTLLVALNAADVHRLSFIKTVLPEAASRGMGVIGMKVYGAGTLLRRRRLFGRIGGSGLSTDEAMGYVLSLLGVSTVVIGCQTPAEVDDNVRVAREFVPFDTPMMRDLESQTQRRAASVTGYKRPA